MSAINISNLTFGYEGSFDYIFENVSFCMDTDWKLGLVGRNGKGKTTLLRLLMGGYEYTGSIQSQAVFDYFPYPVTAQQMQACMADFFSQLRADCELWRVMMELDKMGMDAEVLYRPFGTLSFGEQTRVLLCVLFAGENRFLLIDEPTNHLDAQSRVKVKEYLQKKKGFLLVSHDRDLLDACIDHIVVLNRVSIEVQKGNFSSWWENKERRDSFQTAENAKHQKEIAKLWQASARTRQWAERSERTKIGFDPAKEHDRGIATRAYIGAKTKKMQSRVKQMERRIGSEIEKKEGLLQDVEHPADLKLMPLRHQKELLVRAQGYGLSYGAREVLKDFAFELRQGERVCLCGKNGCGKSSFLHAVLAHAGAVQKEADAMQETGDLWTAGGLIVSYINQDTSALRGGLPAFCEKRQLDESLFKSILRQLDFSRSQFTKPMEEYSQGQKKKVVIAASLLVPAHLYIWDEPLNYVDVFSRMQLESLILRVQPTLLFVEHDVRFQERVATRRILL